MSKRESQRKRFQNFITSDRKQKRSNFGPSTFNSSNNNSSGHSSGPSNNVVSSLNSSNSNSDPERIAIKKWIPNEKIKSNRNIRKAIKNSF